MSVVGKGAALAALLAAGVLLAAALAGGGSAADTITTTTETATQVTTETTTEPTTVTATTTVEETTTETVESTGTTDTTATTATTDTTAATSGGSGTPTWVWVLLGLAAVGLVVLAILLVRRGQPDLSPAERARLLQAAVDSWAGQGWAIQSQTGDSAVLWRGNEQVLVTVDSLGHVSTRPLSGGA